MHPRRRLFIRPGSSLLRRWVAGALLATLAAATAASGEVASGTVSQMGHGKIVLKEKGDLTRTFLEGRRDTSYEPPIWRPEAGDEIEITYIEREQRLVAQQVRLTQVGPNNIDPKDLVSPMEVTVVEVGRSGIFARRGDDARRIRFAFSRSTQYEPVGWKPQVGEKVVVTFRPEANAFTFNVTYAIDRIELKR